MFCRRGACPWQSWQRSGFRGTGAKSAVAPSRWLPGYSLRAVFDCFWSHYLTLGVAGSVQTDPCLSRGPRRYRRRDGQLLAWPSDPLPAARRSPSPIRVSMRQTFNLRGALGFLPHRLDGVEVAEGRRVAGT